MTFLGPQIEQEQQDMMIRNIISLGIGGAVGAQVGSLLGQPATVITNLLDRAIPLSIQEKMYNVASKVGEIANYFHAPLTRGARGAGILTESQYSTFIAPIVEEVTFRLALQEGAATLLTAGGLDPTAAKVVSVVGTSFFFGMAHNGDIRSEQFTSVALQGIAFGTAQALGETAIEGLFAAVLAHMASNGRMNYFPRR